MTDWKGVLGGALAVAFTIISLVSFLLFVGCSPRTTFDCTGDDDPGYACPLRGHE